MGIYRIEGRGEFKFEGCKVFVILGYFSEGFVKSERYFEMIFICLEFDF